MPFGRLEQVPGPLPVQADGDRYLLQLVAADDGVARLFGLQLLLQELTHPVQVLRLFVLLRVPPSRQPPNSLEKNPRLGSSLLEPEELPPPGPPPWLLCALLSSLRSGLGRCPLRLLRRNLRVF